MSVLVVGSVALDTVETPFGKVNDVLGGSAVYFSTAASYFADINLVAVVGDDFPDEHIDFLLSKKIDIKGLQKESGNTFRWEGRYGFDLNEAHTLNTELNVFQDFNPTIPQEYRCTEYVFLANIDPELQSEVLKQVRKPKLVACDTMNFWIEHKPNELKKTIENVDILIINEAEAREFTCESNLVKAATAILSMGPKTLIIKQGEYGALMFTEGSVFSAPAYPLEDIFDPTGAGDSFAGGFMGYLANTHNLENMGIRQAVIFGSVMASFNVEDFSLNRMKNLTYDEIESRYKRFKELTHFDDL
ncbi:MAG: PfkB family carbohydrate kinase [Thermodesulfobacteriota bacterium]|nr:PfkB family carbohydrate kinase [Thermodesulfobacteriota bacterium]